MRSQGLMGVTGLMVVTGFNVGHRLLWLGPRF